MEVAVMKKLFLCMISVLLVLSSISLFPGCGGGNKTTNRSGFKFYDSSGASASVKGGGFFMSGIVFAGTVGSEITQAGLFMDNTGGTMRRGIQVIYHTDDGDPVSGITINITIDYSEAGENDCFSITDIINNSAQVAPSVPGRARIRAEYNGETACIPIHTFNAVGHTSIASGLKINTDNSYENSATDCIINSSGYFTDKAYLYNDATNANVDDFINIKGVNTERLENSDAGQWMIWDCYYIAKNPLGGYAKVFRNSNGTYWEYSATGLFK